MTPWLWHVGRKDEVEDEGLYNISERTSRDGAIADGLRETRRGEQFYIIEARSSEAAQFEGADMVPFLRTRNKKLFTNGVALQGAAGMSGPVILTGMISPILGIPIVLVELGTVIVDERSGEELTVTDSSAVIRNGSVFVTEPVFEALKNHHAMDATLAGDQPAASANARPQPLGSNPKRGEDALADASAGDKGA